MNGHENDGVRMDNEEEATARRLRNARLKRRAATASVLMAVCLVAAKAIAWSMTGSVGLMGSMVDSVMDAVTSLILFSGIRMAQQPADHRHRFGHGKAEALVTLVQGFAIIGSALLVASEAIGRFGAIRVVENSTTGMAVMAAAIIGTIALSLYQTYVMRETGSLAVAADRMHYLGDIGMNFAVIVALFLGSKPEWAWIDPVCGLAIAVLLFWGAAKIGLRACDELLDGELTHRDREAIMAAIGHVTAVEGVHDLRTRRSGDMIFIECHVELDPDMPLHEVYLVLEEVRTSICRRYHAAEIAIQPDPIGIEEDRLDERLGLGGERLGLGGERLG